MSRYSEETYTLEYALQNIGRGFWNKYKDDLDEFVRDTSRIDIANKIHREWDKLGNSPVGTNIRIEWAVAIYKHGDWEKAVGKKDTVIENKELCDYSFGELFKAIWIKIKRSFS